MKKFLSIFVALAMVLSLFAGVGAHTAKAAAGDVSAWLISHSETAKTIVYGFNVPVLLQKKMADNQTVDPNGALTPIDNAALLAVYAVSDYAKQSVVITSAVLDAAGTTLTMTYTGTLDAGAYFVDAWSYAIVSKVAPTTDYLVSNSGVEFTVPAAAEAGVIALGTPATIAAGDVDPTLQVTAGDGFVFVVPTTVADWAIGVASTGLTVDTITAAADGTTATIAFTGTAVAGTVVTIQALTAAFPAATDSNVLSVIVPGGTEISIAAVPGVTAPATGAVPVAVITPTAQYTGAVTWTPALAAGTTTFAASTAYTAAITLAPKAGFTVNGVAANFFTVAGSTSDTNPINSGAVTAAFAATGAVGAQLTIANPTLTLSKAADTTTTAAVTAGALIGVASPDVVTVTAVANYDTAAVGTGKTITVVYTLGGADAAKYVKPVNYVVTTGVITAAVAVGIPVLTLTQPLTTTYVKLDWTYAGAAVTGFSIYRNQTGATPDPAVFAPIYTAAAGTTGTYIDATTVANQVYYYWVGAVTATGTTLSAPKAISTTVATVAVPVIPGTTAGTLGITTTGTFVGGADGSGVAAVNGIGKVMSITDANTAVVNVTTAAAGSFDTVNGVKLLHIFTAGATISPNWYNTGSQLITFNPAEPTFVLGQTITVGASGTPGSGKITSINPAGTTAYVNVTTAAVGIFDGNIYTRTLYIPSIDPDWMTVGATQVITIPTAGMGAGDLLTAYMTQAVPATSATAFFMVTGTPVVGDVATITFQDSAAASHTVTYTTKAGDTAATVAQTLSQLIDAQDTASGYDFVYSTYTVGASVVQLTQENAGTVGNGKTLTGTTTASVVPTLTIHTLGGLNSPAYVELGKTIKLVAVDATGAVVSCTWTSVGSAAPAGPSAVVNASGLVTADLALTGVTVVTAKSGSATGVFAVVVIPVQIITSLKINLVPAVPVSTTSQQFGAIASNAAYSALDYTTQAVWTDALPVASIAATTGLLTYSTDETGNVFASAGGITATSNVKIATGVVTLPPVVGPVTKVIVLTIGSDIVTVDGKATTVDASPEITNGRTFVPIRFIAETFGSTVTWLPETKGVTIVLGDTTIGLQIGNATAVINGTIIALDAAPYIKNSRTMVPLRVITESFGGNVAWDPINHIITITYVLPVVVTPAS